MATHQTTPQFWLHLRATGSRRPECYRGISWWNKMVARMPSPAYGRRCTFTIMLWEIVILHWSSLKNRHWCEPIYWRLTDQLCVVNMDENEQRWIHTIMIKWMFCVSLSFSKGFGLTIYSVKENTGWNLKNLDHQLYQMNVKTKCIGKKWEKIT